MNNFLRRMEEKNKQRTHMTYTQLRNIGAMRAVTVRLPVTTIKKMQLLEQKCLGQWESRQEMLFDMIECAILDWVESGGFPQGEFEEFQRVAYEGLRNDPTKATATFRDETPEI
jgi:hypothetical protein